MQKKINRQNLEKIPHTTLSTLAGVGGNFLLGLGEEFAEGNFLPVDLELVMLCCVVLVMSSIQASF